MIEVVAELQSLNTRPEPRADNLAVEQKTGLEEGRFEPVSSTALFTSVLQPDLMYQLRAEQD